MKYYKHIDIKYLLKLKNYNKIKKKSITFNLLSNVFFYSVFSINHKID